MPGHVERLLVLGEPRHGDGSPVAEGVVGDRLIGRDVLGSNIHGSHADLKSFDKAAP